MKFAKLFMVVAVMALLVSCGAESHLKKAEKAIDKKEWVKAAEALSKIKGDDIEKWIDKEPTKAMRTFVATGIIVLQDKEKANKIIEEWIEEEAQDIDNIDKLLKIIPIDELLNNFGGGYYGGDYDDYYDYY